MAWIWPLSVSNTSIKWLSTKAVTLEAGTVLGIMTRKCLSSAEITFVKEYCRPRCPLQMLKEIPHHDHSKEISTLRALLFWVSSSVSELWALQDLCLLNTAWQQNTKVVSDSKWEMESNKPSFEIRQSLEIKVKKKWEEDIRKKCSADVASPWYAANLQFPRQGAKIRHTEWKCSWQGLPGGWQQSPAEKGTAGTRAKDKQISVWVTQ